MDRILLLYRKKTSFRALKIKKGGIHIHVLPPSEKDKLSAKPAHRGRAPPTH